MTANVALDNEDGRIQEEIREGLAKEQFERATKQFPTDYTCWEQLSQELKDRWLASVDDDFKYLHSKGVMIQRELEAHEDNYGSYPFEYEPLIEVTE